MVELLLGWMLLGLIPAVIAHARGLPPAVWWLYGVLLWPVALVHVFFATPGSVTIGAVADAPLPRRSAPDSQVGAFAVVAVLLAAAAVGGAAAWYLIP